MKLIGVDFGSKRVGVAIADTEAKIAFPKCVLKNDENFFEVFRKLCQEENAEIVILGDSKNFEMKDNPIMSDIKKFKEKIETELNLKVKMHPEFLSSAQAVHEQGENQMLDASAATIILQSYIDRAYNF